MNGTVKWFDQKKRYGYVLCENQSEVFVHSSAIKARMEDRVLFMGDRITFEVVETERGPRAEKVHIMERNSPMALIHQQD